MRLICFIFLMDVFLIASPPSIGLSVAERVFLWDLLNFIMYYYHLLLYVEHSRTASSSTVVMLNRIVKVTTKYSKDIYYFKNTQNPLTSNKQFQRMKTFSLFWFRFSFHYFDDVSSILHSRNGSHEWNGRTNREKNMKCESLNWKLSQLCVRR